MDRMQIDELIYMLEQQDPAAKILFVEGLRDSAFWERVVPVAERGSASVYPIDRIHVEGQVGGCKGRALRLAEILAAYNFQDRVVFFLDSDEFYLAGSDVPENVVLTDFRDREGYAVNVGLVKEILYSVGMDEERGGEVYKNCADICADIGILRLIDFILDFSLPFNQSFGSKPGKVLRRKDGLCEFSKIDLLNRLFQNAGRKQSCRDLFKEKLSDIQETVSNVDKIHLIRGKDFITVIGFCIDESENLISAVLEIYLIKSIEGYRNFPNFGRIESFVRQ